LLTSAICSNNWNRKKWSSVQSIEEADGWLNNGDLVGETAKGKQLCAGFNYVSTEQK
jgi:hypothetical protein